MPETRRGNPFTREAEQGGETKEEKKKNILVTDARGEDKGDGRVGGHSTLGMKCAIVASCNISNN